MPNADVLQVGIGAASVPITGAAVTPLPWGAIIESAQFINASIGSPEIQFSADGIFFAQWTVSINVASLGRKNSQTSLLLDSGGGFVPVPEVFGFGYHRNTTDGRDTTAGKFRGTVSAGNRIEIASQRISGTGNLEFIASSCSLIVGLIPLG